MTALLNFLQALPERPEWPIPSCDGHDWLRLVTVRAEPANVRAMIRALRPARFLDRYYNSLDQYHRGRPNIYATCVGEQCAIRYVAVAVGRVILCPHTLSGRNWLSLASLTALPNPSSDGSSRRCCRVTAMQSAFMTPLHRATRYAEARSAALL